MARENTQMAKKIDTIHASLKSGKYEKVIGALKEIKQYGTKDTIPLLIDILVHTDDERLYAATVKILNELKDKDVVDIFIEAIENPENKEEQQTLLQAIWQAGLHADDHLAYFVDLAMKSEYMIAFECYTIIEEMGGVDDEEVFTLIGDLREAQLRKNENEQVLELIIQSLNEKVIG